MAGEVGTHQRGTNLALHDHVDEASANCHAAEGQLWTAGGAPFPYSSRCEGAYASSDAVSPEAATEGEDSEWLARILAVLAATTNPLKGIGPAVTDGIAGSVVETLSPKDGKPDKPTSADSAAPKPAKKRAGRAALFPEEKWIDIVRFFWANNRNFALTVEKFQLGKDFLRSTLQKREGWLQRRENGTRLPTSAPEKQNPPPSSMHMDWNDFLEAQAKHLKSGGSP